MEVKEKEKRYSFCSFTIEQEKQICEEYINGEGTTILAKKYNSNPSTIYNILKVYNIKRRTLSEARRKYINYTLNENIFENIDNPDKSYWIGVMYSDGYISKNKYTNKMGIAVKADDEEWLLKFKEFLNYNGEIGHYLTTESGYKSNSPYVRLSIGNNKIVSDLEKIGVVEHKSKIISKIPDIPYKDDFIRGYIDGDGSLLKIRPTFQISGNESFLLDIANYFQIPYHIYPDKTIYSLKYNVQESRYLEKRLYKNAHYYLNRKYEIAKRSFDSPITLEDVMKTSNIKENP